MLSYLKSKSHWLLATCFIVVSLVSLVAAPPQFVQSTLADGGSCDVDHPCGLDEFCCNGTCQACPCN
jgi:hypothetical protein